MLSGYVLRYLFNFGWSESYIRYLNEKIKVNDLNKTLLIYRLSIQFLVILLFFGIGPDFWCNKLFGNFTWSNSLIAILIDFVARENLLFFETRYRVKNEKIILFHAGMIIFFNNFFFLFFLKYDLGINGIVWSISSLSNLIVLIILIAVDNKWLFKGVFSFKIFNKLNYYGLPLVPAGLTVMSINASDRYMLNWLLPSDEGLLAVGQYALAMKFIGILTLFSAGFSVFLEPYYLDLFNRNKKQLKEKVKKFFVYYVLLLSIAIVPILLIVPILYQNYLIDFSNGYLVVPIMMASMLSYVVGDYFCIGIALYEKSSIRAYAGLAVLIVNLSLNYILIPEFGIFGAVLATFISNVAYVYILLKSSNSLYPIDYNFSFWIIMISLLIGWTFIYNYLPTFSIIYGLFLITYLIYVFFNNNVYYVFRRK